MPAPVDISDPFRAFSDPTRREIVSLLAGGPLPVRLIAGHFPSISRPAVSKHLRVLREGGVVSEERSGRERYYRLELGTVDSALEWMAGVGARSGGAETKPPKAASRRAARPTPVLEVKAPPPIEPESPELEPLEPQPTADAGGDPGDWKSW